MPRLLAWVLVAGALHVCACSSRPAHLGQAIGFQNIHMASCSGGTSSLSTRTVNEIAAVLETLNGP